MDSFSRNDVGAVFENVCIVERMKKNMLEQNKSPIYFWRSDREGEIDYVEEKDSVLYAFEFKYNQEGRDLTNVKIPKAFASAYPQHEYTVIDRGGVARFL